MSELFSFLYYKEQPCLEDDALRAGIQYALGDDSRGFAKDETLALQYFTALTRDSHFGGKFFLGLCYYNGVGTPKDESKGKDLVREAAAEGDMNARRALCSLHFVPQRVCEILETIREWREEFEWETHLPKDWKKRNPKLSEAEAKKLVDKAYGG